MFEVFCGGLWATLDRLRSHEDVKQVLAFACVAKEVRAISTRAGGKLRFGWRSPSPVLLASGMHGLAIAALIAQLPKTTYTTPHPYKAVG
jgi:hypothetical protein